MNKGKRNADEIVEKQIASSKKQKTMNQESSSYEESSEKPVKESSDYSDEEEPKKPVVAASKKVKSYNESESDDEEEAKATKEACCWCCCLSCKEERINFFKSAGEVVEVRFAMDDGGFLGYGDVDFATHEAALEALTLHEKTLLDKPVYLAMLAHTPGFEEGLCTLKEHQANGGRGRCGHGSRFGGKNEPEIPLNRVGSRF